MNTFHLNPELRKIASPIRVVTENEELSFSSGQELVAHSFDKPYKVEKIRAEENSIVLELIEQSSTPTNWAGEEQTSFF